MLCFFKIMLFSIFDLSVVLKNCWIFLMSQARNTDLVRFALDGDLILVQAILADAEPALGAVGSILLYKKAERYLAPVTLVLLRLGNRFGIKGSPSLIRLFPIVEELRLCRRVDNAALYRDHTLPKIIHTRFDILF